MGKCLRSRHSRRLQLFGDDIPGPGTLWCVPAREAVKIVSSLSPCLIAIQVYFRHMNSRTCPLHFMSASRHFAPFYGMPSAQKYLSARHGHPPVFITSRIVWASSLGGSSVAQTRPL